MKVNPDRTESDKKQGKQVFTMGAHTWQDGL